MDLSVFDMKVPRIRLDISGKGLDFLRNYRDDDLDVFLRSEDQMLPGQHVTRCDFAFDFVNYKPELLDQLVDYIQLNHTDADRLCIMNKTSAMAYKIRTGNEKTVYVGSPQSDKLLRVYDKKKQFTDPTGQFYIKENDYENPDSWIRVEWQLRNAWAGRVLYAHYEDSEMNMLSVLKEIYKEYNFADLSTPAHRRQAHPFWQGVFDDWNLIKSIIQNKSFRQYKQSFYTRVKEGYPRWMNQFLYFIAAVGVEQFRSVVDQWLHDMQHFDKTPNPIHNNKRWNAFINHMNELGQGSYTFYRSDSPIFMNHQGDLCFNFKGSGY